MWVQQDNQVTDNNQHGGEVMIVGDKVKVIDQEIYGKIIHDYGTEVVIEDEDAETDDNTLCFKKSEIEEVK